jgi:1-deoxy-D-xylulose-5-phosphate reductoisomerase
MSEPRTVAVVGSTGSIGTQALEVIAASGGALRLVALAAGSQVEALAQQARDLAVPIVAVADAERARELARLVPAGTQVVAGPEGLEQVAAQADVCLNAAVGFAGLPVTMAALAAGRRLALANKESLIAAGPVVRPVRATPGAELVPVDSEHCAIHQCLRSGRDGEVSRLVLTASGGPFRGRAASDLAEVTVEDALAHPTWSMGPKITIDSSTLMNKGLEVIEAHELFGVGYDSIDVVIHPQSIVHSMVEFRDGSTVAQLSAPDMRLPIGYALAHPDRFDRPFGRLDWTEVGRLDFEAPDRSVFRGLDLAYRAGRAGGTAPAWLSAANEVAVDAFLAGAIPWPAIAEVVDETLQSWPDAPAASVADILEADRRGREVAGRVVERRETAA